MSPKHSKQAHTARVMPAVNVWSYAFKFQLHELFLYLCQRKFANHFLTVVNVSFSGLK